MAGRGAVTNGLHAAGDTGEAVLREAGAAFRADAEAVADMARQDARLADSAAGGGAVTRQAGHLADTAAAFHNDPAALRNSTNNATNKAASSKATNLTKSADDVKGDAAAFRGKSSGDKLADANARAASQGWSTTDKLAALTGITVISLGLASFVSTDGARLNISDIVIINSTQVRVDYDVASVGAGGLVSNFSLRVGDYVTFDQPTPTVPNLSGDQQVIAVAGDHTFYISPSPMLQTSGGLGVSAMSPSGVYLPVGAPAGSSTGAPIGSSFWHGATVHSTMSNQLTGTLVDGINIVGAAASAAVIAATPALVTVTTDVADAAAAAAAGLTPAAVSLVSSAANVAAGAVHALTPALENTICDIFPLVCNATLWWSVGGICACLIVIAIILKLKR